MSTLINRKNKITLTDYNYRQDIENRLFMAELSILEVDVLREIINGSLKTSLANLADNLNITPKELKTVLDKLVKSRLFQIHGDWITVDKEMRKYYEAQIIKFDDDFKPDLEYLQGLLTKVPIHSLPIWYAIPRSSNSIFQSIVEKFLVTPRTYERYLQDLTFEDPVLSQIVDEVFNAPNYKISAHKLLEKLSLTREQFEEHILFLEFSLVCCISYTKTKNLWEEVVTPFHEWRELLLFVQNSNPPIISQAKSIEPSYNKEFDFLNELNGFVKSLLKKEADTKGACPKLLDMATLLKIAQIKKQKISSTVYTSEWLDKKINEQAMILYRQSLYRLLSQKEYSLFSEKDCREVEKSLKRLSHGEWVYFDDFIKGCLAAVGDAQPVHLQNKGRRWKYCTPLYRETEVEFIKHILSEHLQAAGMVTTGYHNDKFCLSLTSFGRLTLS